MGWETEIADVVAGQTIASQWGNQIRDQIVHVVSTLAALPAPADVGDGAVAFNEADQLLRVTTGGAWVTVPNLAGADGRYVRSDGTGQMTGALSMGGNLIGGIGDATAPNHALSRGVGDGRYIQVDGSNSMAGNLGMDQNRIVGVGDPTGGTNAMSRGYADARYQQTTSARALKSSITDAKHLGAVIVAQLRPVEFDWTPPANDAELVGVPAHTLGFVAEEVHAVSDMLTAPPASDGTVPGIDLRPVVAALVGAVQALTARVADLEAVTP